MSRTDLLSLRQVCFSYPGGTPALREVSLTIQAGEFVAFVGQNGAGKTTCAKLLNGILKPDQGEVWVNGQETRQTPASVLAQTVGYCYQHPDHQIWALHVADELAFGPRNLGLSPAEVQQRVEEALALVDLTAQHDHYTFSLGWGERQKLAVAAILAMRPRVIVVDEPTTGLDWDGSRRIMDLLNHLNEHGLTVIIITHDMNVVAAYARRCVVFADGCVIRDGSTAAVLQDRPALQQAHLRPPQFIRMAQALAHCGIAVSAASPETLKADLRQRLQAKRVNVH
jgi:energy-coupling factor transport system ATP-binding protein